jgi:hypothetical protein
MMSFGWGILLTKSQKQKLNTKSSTEGEIVGVSDYLPNIIWARMFLEAQGITISENILYQDNQSAIKIEQNGKLSSGQKTKHMDARYFFIKDRLHTEGIEVKYCPTELMIADFFTKPLQGTLFRKFRDVIMGHQHVNTLNQSTEHSSSQERVEKTISSITDSGSDRSTSVENATNDKPNEHTDRPNVDRPKTNDNKVETKKNVSFFLNNPN